MPLLLAPLLLMTAMNALSQTSMLIRQRFKYENDASTATIPPHGEFGEERGATPTTMVATPGRRNLSLLPFEPCSRIKERQFLFSAAPYGPNNQIVVR